MSQQPDLFSPMARPHHSHRMVDTSITAYREIASSLSTRESMVLATMRHYAAAPATAMEIARWMEIDGLIDDSNGCKPRLTALCKRGIVRKVAKRACRITGKTAWTLAIVGEER